MFVMLRFYKGESNVADFGKAPQHFHSEKLIYLKSKQHENIKQILQQKHT